MENRLVIASKGESPRVGVAVKMWHKEGGVAVVKLKVLLVMMVACSYTCDGIA